VAESFRKWKRAELAALDDEGLTFATLACLRAMADGWTAGRAWACDDCRYTWQDRGREDRYEEAVEAVNQERRGMRDWNRRQAGSNTNQAGERTMSGKQNGTAITVAQEQGKGLPTRTNFNEEQVDLVKRMIAKGASDDELALFLQQCSRTGLDPFSKQIYAIKRWDSKEKREVLQVQVSIDGLRLIAERTEQTDGQDGPYWCGKDGVWKDVWLLAEPPVAAKVVVWKKGRTRPYTGIARYAAYVQTTKDGTPTSFWSRMPDVMLAKCAEALALRKAFPHELAGLYTGDEFGHDEADDHHDAAPQQPARTPVITAQPASKPAQPQQPKGADIATRLKAKEAMLVGEGVCGEGELVAHVTKAMVKAGFEQDPSVWAEAEIKQTAFPAAKEFEDRKRAVAKAKHVVAGKQKGDAYEGDPEPEEVGARR
jgi:phage recombination protein Bet